jgi:uncharacterized membrane protein YoaK (UPF0700 family)
MPAIPLGLLRGCLALLGLFFAYMLGRAVAKHVRRQAKPRIAGWAIRTALVLAAISWRSGIDTVTVLAWVLAVLASAAGYVLESRPRKTEDLTGMIFPGEH